MKIDKVIRNILGLTKAEYIVMKLFNEKKLVSINTEDLSKATKLNLTTIQKAVKKLHHQNIITRNQKNFDSGGYMFVYGYRDIDTIRDILYHKFKDWTDRIEIQIDSLGK